MQIFNSLVSVNELVSLGAEKNWVVVDCRFNLANKGEGKMAYEQAHIPGAVYAHLEDDLSDMEIMAAGRHPLPSPAKMIALFERLGISNHCQVVVYDDAGGAYAARLWWMLGYMGHSAVAVLNGGWPAWLASGLPVAAGIAVNPAGQFQGTPRPEWIVSADELSQAPLVVDSRDEKRYRGEIEPIDPVAGHIPGAVNYFYRQNVDEGGWFRPEQQVRQQLQAIMQGIPAHEAVFYCGSGVTACHNLLAQVYAGLPQGRLYPGSWSEWSSKGLPIATERKI